MPTTRTYVTIALTAALALSGCSDDNSSPNELPDASALIGNVANTVILATYADLDAKATALQAAVTTFNTTPNDGNLTAARNAWRAAREPWEKSEGFLFGPVTGGIDPSLDSWPVDVTDLNAVLAGATPLTKAYLDGQDGNRKGFHTIEYLLFGTSGTKAVADSTARQREYLVAAAASLQGDAARLHNAWATSGDDFVSQLANAGSGSTTYPSQSSALQELVNKTAEICDEVANGKINGPFSEQDRTLEESQFSNNSNVDFANNIRSVQNIYLGTLNASSGQGLTILIAELDPATDTKVKTQMAAAITAIGNMTPTFGEAITDNQAAVQAALTAVLALKTTLESDVLTLITGT